MSKNVQDTPLYYQEFLDWINNKSDKDDLYSMATGPDKVASYESIIVQLRKNFEQSYEAQCKLFEDNKEIYKKPVTRDLHYQHYLDTLLRPLHEREIPLAHLLCDFKLAMMNKYKLFSDDETKKLDEDVLQLRDYILKGFTDTFLYDDEPDHVPQSRKSIDQPSTPSTPKPAATQAHQQRSPSPAIKTQNQKTTHEKKFTSDQNKTFENAVKVYFRANAGLKLSSAEERILDKMIQEYQNNRNIAAIKRNADKWLAQLLPQLGNKQVAANRYFNEFITAFHAAEDQSKPGGKKLSTKK